MFTVGYSLAFGAVLAKMWRVFHIFHNPKPNKTVRQLPRHSYSQLLVFVLQTMKDWMLIVITLTTCAIVVLLLFLETVVPDLMGFVIKERDSEKLYGMDVSI